MCLKEAENSCIADFPFFLIESQNQGLTKPVNGVLGLARDMPHYLSKNDVSVRGPSYLHALRNAELIQEATFSFATSPLGYESFIDLGPHNNSRVMAGEDLEWIDV